MRHHYNNLLQDSNACRDDLIRSKDLFPKSPDDRLSLKNLSCDPFLQHLNHGSGIQRIESMTPYCGDIVAEIRETASSLSYAFCQVTLHQFLQRIPLSVMGSCTSSFFLPLHNNPVDM